MHFAGFKEIEAGRIVHRHAEGEAGNWPNARMFADRSYTAALRAVC